MVYRDDSKGGACREFKQELVLYYYGEGGEKERLT